MSETVTVSREPHRRESGLSDGDVGRLRALPPSPRPAGIATSRRRLAVALVSSLLLHATAMAISARLAPSAASPTEPLAAVIRSGPASAAAQAGTQPVSLTLRVTPARTPTRERAESDERAESPERTERAFPDPARPQPIEPQSIEWESIEPQPMEPQPLEPREIEWSRPLARPSAVPEPASVSGPAIVSEPLSESVASLPPDVTPGDRAVGPPRQSQTPEIRDRRRPRDPHRVRRSDPPLEAIAKASEPATVSEPASEITPQPVDPSPAVGDADSDTVAAAGRRDPPRPLASNEPPSYPPSAVNRRWEGTARLGVSVDATGRVTRVEIRESSGHAILDRAARDAVARWRFEAASPAAGSAEQTVLVPVRFQLDRVY